MLHGKMLSGQAPSSDIDLDERLVNSSRFWDLTEIRCDPLCCGLDAFSSKKKDVERAAAILGESGLLSQLVELRDQILEKPANNAPSDRLNYPSDKFYFTALVEYLIEKVQGLPAATRSSTEDHTAEAGFVRPKRASIADSRLFKGGHNLLAQPGERCRRRQS